MLENLRKIEALLLQHNGEIPTHVGDEIDDLVKACIERIDPK